jgi:hypothetical protein
MHINLQLDGSPIGFDVSRVIVAGYTGRDQNQVRMHIVELERHGIPAPPTFPTMYPLAARFATVDAELEVGPKVSGEVEPALLFAGDTLESALVSVIVDFTDREEEKRSIAKSKLFPKPFSPMVWKYNDVAGFWDEIALRSRVGEPNDPQPYQSGKLAQLLPPRQLLDRLDLGSDLKGTVLLMGTVPLLFKEFSFSDYFECELEAPQGSKLSYRCTLRRQPIR